MNEIAPINKHFLESINVTIDMHQTHLSLSEECLLQKKFQKIKTINCKKLNNYQLCRIWWTVAFCKLEIFSASNSEAWKVYINENCYNNNRCILIAKNIQIKKGPLFSLHHVAITFYWVINLISYFYKILAILATLTEEIIGKDIIAEINVANWETYRRI